jgi:4-amino-4-deoxy-L-arabinose transferase-like glycosyltransferase
MAPRPNAARPVKKQLDRTLLTKQLDRTPWILFLLACAERLAFMIGSRDRAWPFPVFYEGDAEAFYNYAQAILRGTPYDNGIPFHPPFFPLVLAGLQALTGDPVRHALVRGILGIGSAAVPAMLYLLLRDSAGRAAALAAGLLAVFSFGLDAIGVSATSEGIFMLLALGLLLLARREPGDAKRPEIRAITLGFGSGLLALTRAEGIFLGIAVLAVWLSPLARGQTKRCARLAGIAAAGLLLALAPWTIRNAVRLSEWNERAGRGMGATLPTFVPLTAYGPLNFALANNDEATGGFQRKILTSRSETAVLDLADPQHRHYFLHGTGDGMRWIVSHPDRFASLALRKLGITARALDLGWLPWNLPAGRRGTRLPVDLFHPDAGGLRWAQILLAAAGIALLVRRGHERRLLLLLAIPPITVLLATLLFFGYVRLGMTAAPSIFAFEGIAIAAIAARLPRGARLLLSRPLAWRILLAAALALLVFAGTQSRDYRASGTSDRPGGQLQRDAPIRIEPLAR